MARKQNSQFLILYRTSITSAIQTASGQRSLMSCESCSTSQILLAHSGRHLRNKIFPEPCSDFSSSFDPSDHSAPPISPNPLAAAPDLVPQPPPYVPSSLPPLEQAAAAPNPSPKTSAPPFTPRIPRLYPNLHRAPPHTRSEQL